MENLNLSNNVLNKRNDLVEWLKRILKNTHVSVETKEENIFVRLRGKLICIVSVEDNTYKIYNVSNEWEDETTYHCEKFGDETLLYYLDSIDECIGEVQRLVKYETSNITSDKKRHKKMVEQIIDDLSKENPAITYYTDNKIDTPVYLNGERVMHIYYRKNDVRIYVYTNTRQYDIYLNDIPKNIAYQKNGADPESAANEYAFFVNDNNIEFVLRKLLTNVG
jgi:hypothetical protein